MRLVQVGIHLYIFIFVIEAAPKEPDNDAKENLKNLELEKNEVDSQTLNTSPLISSCSGNNGADKHTSSLMTPNPPFQLLLEVLTNSSRIQNLSLDTNQYLQDLRQTLNRDQGLVDVVTSRFFEMSSRFHQIKEDDRALQRVAPKLVQWALSRDPEEVRLRLVLLNDDRGLNLKWLDQYALDQPVNMWSSPIPNSSPKRHRASIFETLSTFWSIGPFSLLKLVMLGQNLNQDGLEKSVDSRIKMVDAKVQQILENEQNYQIVMPKVVHWVVIKQDCWSIRKLMENKNKNLQLFLELTNDI